MSLYIKIKIFSLEILISEINTGTVLGGWNELIDQCKMVVNDLIGVRRLGSEVQIHSNRN